jgi:hypothetical protein
MVVGASQEHTMSTSSFAGLVIDGALRAAALLPFALALPTAPAAAQLPRATLPPVTISTPVAAPTVMLDPASSHAPLVLAKSHLDVHVVGAQAWITRTLVYRNDSRIPVLAQTTLPEYSLLEGPQGETFGGPLEGDIDGCGNEPMERAQFAEVGERPFPRYEQVTVRVEPGEALTFTQRTPTDLIVRGDRYWLVLPLTADAHAAFAPAFSADVTVVAQGTVRALHSATHGGEVLGTGDTVARLSVPADTGRGSRFFALDFEVGTPMFDTVALAAPAR